MVRGGGGDGEGRRGDGEGRRRRAVCAVQRIIFASQLADQI